MVSIAETTKGMAVYWGTGRRKSACRQSPPSPW